uniref:Uncharacterized protein n=1 Tax=Arundo donax TaxID=35708 RepID=A0A0A9DMN4_ARUDO
MVGQGQDGGWIWPLLRFSVPYCLLRFGLDFEVKALGEELGMGFLGIGFQSKWPRSIYQ